jgi:hypothetical protein
MIRVQDATGGRTFAWAAAVKGGMDIGGSALAPNAIVTQKFHVDGSNLIAISPGTVN